MSAENVEVAILKALSGSDAVSSVELSAQLQAAHQDVVGAAKSLEAEGYITSEMGTRPVTKLSREAHQIMEHGAPEYRLWCLLKDGPVSQDEATKQLGKEDTAVAMSNGMKAKIFKINKAGGAVSLERTAGGAEVHDTVRALLEKLSKNEEVDAKDVDMLKKRKLASIEMTKVFTYAKGPGYAPLRRAKAAGDLTREMLADGSWKTTEFKKYNFDACGAEVTGGQLHPLLKVRQEFREILLEQGFQEMPTQHWAEASFWNFDSLFIPQQHPARDVQDTFFLSKPSKATLTEEDYVARVKAQHEMSFRNDWKEEEARNNVLRTHTTGSSSYILYRLAQQAQKGPDGKINLKPGRYFSIDRVFRNEEMDRTHLCEFHQVEGCVVDRDISLAKMMHTFNSFFRRIGVSQLRFKPAFNPYTEPSMEIFGFHTGLNKWIEVGNSGLFRPELLGPMGFDEGVSVMAWGLSLERPTMIKYGINNIHELFGHRVDIKFIKRAPIARY